MRDVKKAIDEGRKILMDSTLDVRLDELREIKRISDAERAGDTTGKIINALYFGVAIGHRAAKKARK